MTEELSNRFVEASLKRANEALRGARILLEEGELYGAVSRIYYAVFHAAKAMLYSKGFKAKSHSGLRALFGEHIIKPGIMSREYSDTLRDVFDSRQLSDYEVYAEFDRYEVGTLADKAERFLKGVSDLLRKA